MERSLPVVEDQSPSFQQVRPLSLVGCLLQEQYCVRGIISAELQDSGAP